MSRWMKNWPARGSLPFLVAAGLVSPAAAINIVINPNLALSANGDALAAFERAAVQWENIITDPITVTIDAGLADLGSSILGQASSVILSSSFNSIRGDLIADASDEPEDSLVSSLPNAAQFSATLPPGITLSGSLSTSKASLKAMEVTGLDAQFGFTDATITFSSQFGFDYDNSNGIGSGLYDFESVAAHEIGHALGFYSVVDAVQVLVSSDLTGSVTPSALDLFRFADDVSGEDPASTANFRNYPRNLVPGADAITDFLTTEIPMSDGISRQASHWKDSLGLGLMDPTLAAGEVVNILYNDALALDLIGYDIDMAAFTAIPEPSAVAMTLVSVLLLLRLRRRRRG